MGTAKTFMLLAALTALFMAVGYLIGGVLGMAIAFVVASTKTFDTKQLLKLRVDKPFMHSVAKFVRYNV